MLCSSKFSSEMKIPTISKCQKWIVLCVLSAIIINYQCEAADKQRLQRLVKKLTRLIDNLYVDQQVPKKSKSEDEKTTLSTTDTTTLATTPATTPATTLAVKSTVATTQDPNKSYCNDAPCHVPKCSTAEITYYGNLRKKSPLPKFYMICDQRIVSSMFLKSYPDAWNAACLYNMTLVSFNSEEILSCANTVHTGEKGVSKSGMKYWTSGRYFKNCNSYIWCPSREVFGSGIKWKKGFPKENAGECVAIHLGHSDPDSNGLYNTKCADPLFSFGTSADIYD